MREAELELGEEDQPLPSQRLLPGQPWRESSALASRTQVATEQSDLQAIGYLLAAA